jgi:hypothetical protein
MASYEDNYRIRMNKFKDQLWNQLEIIPDLSSDIQSNVLAYLLELACQAQHIANIQLGRNALWKLPREWLLAHIEIAAEPLLQLQEEWEFRRLLEVFWELDRELVRKYANQGLKSQNPDIREASEDFLEMLRSDRRWPY